MPGNEGAKLDRFRSSQLHSDSEEWKMKRRRKLVLKHRICMKCNHRCDHEDKQCPKCGAETFSLNTKFERQKYPRRFPCEPEKSHSLPVKPVGVKMPGEYKIPGARILRGGQIESKRSKH